MHILPDESVRDLEGFWDFIRAQGITRLLIVPSMLQVSLDMPGFVAPPVKLVVLMGEYLQSRLAGRAIAAFPAATALVSIYGSTEASSTLVSNLRESWREGEELPLGMPISPDVRRRCWAPRSRRSRRARAACSTWRAPHCLRSTSAIRR